MSASPIAAEASRPSCSSAFVRERDRGRAGIQLSVDAENTTGAVGLYERVGMRPTQVLQGYSCAL